MIKRLFPVLLAVILLTATAYAAEPDLPDGINITDITERQSEVNNFTLPQFYPTDIQYKNENGIKLLLKTYEVDPEVSPNMLIEKGEHKIVDISNDKKADIIVYKKDAQTGQLLAGAIIKASHR